VEDLEDRLVPRGFVAGDGEGEGGTREIIFPADQTAEAQAGLGELPDIGERGIGIGVAREDLQPLAEVLVDDGGQAVIRRQPVEAPRIHAPQAEGVAADPEARDGRREADLAETEKVPLAEERVHLIADGLAVTVADAAGEIKKFRRVNGHPEHRTMAREGHGGIPREVAVDE